MRKKEDSGKYILENNLRTWSELKRERLALAATKEREKTGNGNSNFTSSLTGAAEKAGRGANDKEKEKEKKMGLGGLGDGKEGTVRRKWGGCPNGCDHGKHSFKKENSMHAMVTNGRPAIMSSTSTTTSPILAAGENGPSQQSIQFRRPSARRWQSSSEDEADPRGMAPFAVDVDKSLDDLVSSPDGTPSFISVEDRLRSRLKSPANWKKGGLLSVRGVSNGSSLEGSDTDHDNDSEMFSAEEDLRKREAKGRSARTGAKKRSGTGGGMGGASMSPGGYDNYRGALADALGDQSDVGSDAGANEEVEVEVEMRKLETEMKKDKSVRGSVY